jgi:bacterioferritin-associated ferredoxin
MRLLLVLLVSVGLVLPNFSSPHPSRGGKIADSRQAQEALFEFELRNIELEAMSLGQKASLLLLALAVSQNQVSEAQCKHYLEEATNVGSKLRQAMHAGMRCGALIEELTPVLQEQLAQRYANASVKLLELTFSQPDDTEVVIRALRQLRQKKTPPTTNRQGYIALAFFLFLQKNTVRATVPG